MSNSNYHISVLPAETLKYLNIRPGGIYIDGTVGDGGHTRLILEAGGKVLAIDQDPEALQRTAERFGMGKELNADLTLKTEDLTLTRGNFANVSEIAKRNGFRQVDGVILDLGVSSHQMDEGSRGFSFGKDAPLDMRMDPKLGVTAADLVNALGKNELNELFNKYSQEKFSRVIADAIVSARKVGKIETTGELAGIVESVKSVRDRGKIHPATKVFQALRIAVNDEMGNLEAGLASALLILKPGGRLVVISFHELEDRIVKKFMDNPSLKKITDGIIQASDEEINTNRRSRSARLRAAEKV